jgi:hypothetical protein
MKPTPAYSVELFVPLQHFEGHKNTRRRQQKELLHYTY